MDQIKESPEAVRAAGAGSIRKTTTRHNNTTAQNRRQFWNKKRRILRLLARGETLNRFEAFKHGDTCLHSTVCKIQDDGINVARKAETVAGWQGNPTSVMRYRLTDIEREKAVQRLCAEIAAAGLADSAEAARSALEAGEAD